MFRVGGQLHQRRQARLHVTRSKNFLLLPGIERALFSRYRCVDAANQSRATEPELFHLLPPTGTQHGRLTRSALDLDK